MQNFILVSLIVGLGFFLYLIKIGEIDSRDFNIKNVQGVHFDIAETQRGGLEKSSNLRLNVKGTTYDLYTSTGNSFIHIPRSEYYLNMYNVPLNAKDAVTTTWLGSRIVFYVTEEEINGSKFDLQYHVYKAEYLMDSKAPAEYMQYRLIHGLDVRNTIEVKY